MARKLKLLKLSLPLPAPRDPKLQTELTELAASLEGDYGKGKYCPPGKECQDIGALSKVMAESRNPDELLEAWRGWHAISPPMKPKYERFVELANQGARTLGFPTWARSGARTTTCRPMPSPPRWSGSGSR